MNYEYKKYMYVNGFSCREMPLFLSILNVFLGFLYENGCFLCMLV